MLRAGLGHGATLHEVTVDVLNEVTLEALAHVAIFATVRQLRAWLLGIAANVIKRRHTAFGKQLWSVDAPAYAPSDLVVAQGVVVLFNGEAFCGYDTSDGHKAWC